MPKLASLTKAGYKMTLFHSARLYPMTDTQSLPLLATLCFVVCFTRYRTTGPLSAQPAQPIYVVPVEPSANSLYRRSRHRYAFPQHNHLSYVSDGYGSRMNEGRSMKIPKSSLHRVDNCCSRPVEESGQDGEQVVQYLRPYYTRR